MRFLVEVNSFADNTLYVDLTYNGSAGSAHVSFALMPREARRLAKQLIETADSAETKLLERLTPALLSGKSKVAS